MSTSPATIEYVLDQLVAVPEMASRRMFGEYALYCEGKVVGLVCDDTLYIKITDPGKVFVAHRYTEGAPYPGAKPWMMIDDELLDDREWVSELVRITADAVPLPKPKQPRKHKRK